MPVAVSDVVAIGQSFAHLVPGDGGRRVAKQHDAHQCDVTAFQCLDVGACVGNQRLNCNDDGNNDNIIIYDVIIFMLFYCSFTIDLSTAFNDTSTGHVLSFLSTILNKN